MQQREQLSSWMSRIGIKNYEHFKLTQWFGKIDIVTKEYHERYLKQINTICPGRQLRLDGN